MNLILTGAVTYLGLGLAIRFVRTENRLREGSRGSAVTRKEFVARINAHSYMSIWFDNYLQGAVFDAILAALWVIAMVWLHLGLLLVLLSDTTTSLFRRIAYFGGWATDEF